MSAETGQGDHDEVCGGALDSLRGLEHRLGHAFSDTSLLETAVTHRSGAHERGDDEHYERLEFLGDAVLALVTAEWLFLEFPDAQEGELSGMKSHLVSATVLAREGERLGLGEWLRLGSGEERTGGRQKASLLADSMEAVFGAVFLDRGLDAARGVIRPVLERAWREDPLVIEQDPKTRLQELLQALGRSLPVYRSAGSEGPDHDRVFHYDCVIDGEAVGRGTGRSKKAAEKEAAHDALEGLGLGES